MGRWDYSGINACGRSFAAFHLSACKNVWPHVKLVSGGECLTSWAMSPDITRLLIRQKVCFVLFFSVVPNSESLTDNVLVEKNDYPDILDGLV